MLVPYARWRPDVANLNSSFSPDVLNVLCSADGYIPFPKAAAFSNACAEAPVGGFTARNSAGQVVIFVGTATKLRMLNPTTLDWDDVSKTATTYAASDDERWRFAQYGNFVIAVNVNDAPQVYEIGVSTKFDNLAGSPPRARHIGVWGDFLVLGGLNGNENRVHWSGVNAITTWTPGVNNCDYQDFPDAGDVQGYTSMTNPFVLLQRGIWAGHFAPGSVEVFTFTKVHEKRGAAAAYSIASRGNFTFFAENGGLSQLNPDGSITQIGLEKIDRTVFGTISGPDLFGIVGEIDPFYNRYYLAVKMFSGSASFDTLIIYDWGVGEFTKISGPLGILFPLASGTVGYTLEGLDAISASLDDLPFSLDSKVWQGGAPVMAAIDANKKLAFFSGANAEAMIATQEMGDTGGMMSRVSDPMPIVDTNAVLISIGSRNKRGDAIAWGPEGQQSSNTGIVRMKSRARFHTFRTRIPEAALWTSAQGVDVKTAPAGQR